MNQPPFNTKHWFVCPQPNSKAEMRLFLFPYAGGGPAAFNKWLVEFPDHIEIWAAHYPGRGSRHNQSPIKQLASLVENFSHAIQPLLEKPFVFFGHSMGGMIAFELIRHLRQFKLPQPNFLFISACGAPNLPDPHPPIHALPDAEFLKAIKELKGIPSEILNIPELIELLLPTLRADFEAVETHHHDHNLPALDCPIIAFGGLDDQRVSRERLEGWLSCTNARFHSQYFSGAHFFIHTAKAAVISSIVTEITSSHARR